MYICVYLVSKNVIVFVCVMIGNIVDQKLTPYC